TSAWQMHLHPAERTDMLARRSWATLGICRALAPGAASRYARGSCARGHGASERMTHSATTSFDHFALMPDLKAAVADMGYMRPTPIQAESIPVALAGRDLIGCASTGTGKTAAFVLPILQRLSRAGRGKCRALVLAPTRELALQIDEQVLALG